MQSQISNPKHFWQAVNSAIGKYKESILEIDIDGSLVSDTQLMANQFASSSLTKSKCFLLTQSMIFLFQLQHHHSTFSYEEVEKACKSLNNKKALDQMAYHRTLSRTVLSQWEWPT